MSMIYHRTEMVSPNKIKFIHSNSQIMYSSCVEIEYRDIDGCPLSRDICNVETGGIIRVDVGD